MNTTEIILKNSIKQILQYNRKNAIEIIVKLIMEAIMNAERTDYLAKTLNGNKANGYYERFVRGISKYLKIRVPRDRLSIFKPFFLEAIRQYDGQLSDLAAKLYVKGLSTRDIETILKDIFGKKMSSTSVSNITKEFINERNEWLERPLDCSFLFVFIDALQIFVRRDNVAKEAYYIVMGVDVNLKRKILGVYNIPVESAEGWREVFKDLKKRGLKEVLLFVADGLTGLASVVNKEFPKALFQRCLVHKIRNISICARNKDKRELVDDFRKVFVTGDSGYTFKKAKKALEQFIFKWERKYPKIKSKFKDEEVGNYFAYLKFPAPLQRMIRTTNWIEELNKSIRKTLKIRGSFPSPDSALTLVVAHIMELETSGYLKYLLSSFCEFKEELMDMLSS